MDPSCHHKRGVGVQLSRVIGCFCVGNSKDKADLVAELIEKGHDCQYVSQRVKKGKETNGKSSNLNNCLQNVIYKE